jgi:hypothetical protein
LCRRSASVHCGRVINAPIPHTPETLRSSTRAATDDKRPGASKLAAFACDTAHKTFAIEHVADERAAGAEANGIARTCDFRDRAGVVEQPDGRHLVRHGDQRAVDVRELEYETQEVGVGIRLAAHRHHNRVDAVLLEIRIVDHRRLEALGRVAEMGDEPGRAADHVS